MHAEPPDNGSSTDAVMFVASLREVPVRGRTLARGISSLLQR